MKSKSKAEWAVNQGDDDIQGTGQIAWSKKGQKTRNQESRACENKEIFSREGLRKFSESFIELLWAQPWVGKHKPLPHPMSSSSAPPMNYTSPSHCCQETFNSSWHGYDTHIQNLSTIQPSPSQLSHSFPSRKELSNWPNSTHPGDSSAFSFPRDPTGKKKCHWQWRKSLSMYVKKIVPICPWAMCSHRILTQKGRGWLKTLEGISLPGGWISGYLGVDVISNV